jgi:hypothetical protein
MQNSECDNATGGDAITPPAQIAVVAAAGSLTVVRLVGAYARCTRTVGSLHSTRSRNGCDDPPAHDLTELGGRQYGEGVPTALSDVPTTGELIGPPLWRVRHGCVERLAIRTNGLGLAVRAGAQFSYHCDRDAACITNEG